MPEPGDELVLVLVARLFWVGKHAVGTGPSRALAVPSAGAQHRYAIQSAVNPVLSRVPCTLFLLPPQKKKAVLLKIPVGL